MTSDRAYWIIWYNLPAEARDAHLEWAHENYIPRVLARPGVLWGAHYASETNFTPLGGGGRISHKPQPAGVPPGDRFILMFGAADPYVFADPDPEAFHASLPESDRRRVAERAEVRMNIMLEEGRIDGPEARRDRTDLTPAPAIQLGSFNAASAADEFEQAKWYARWRLPSLKTVPGVVRVRKLVSVAGWAKHACFYEFTSLEARHAHFVHYEKPHPAMVAWSTAVVRDTVHAPGSANVARRLWPPVASGDQTQEKR
jgi:hypothetical protein